jgi:hypothetical protein
MFGERLRRQRRIRRNQNIKQSALTPNKFSVKAEIKQRQEIVMNYQDVDNENYRLVHYLIQQGSGEYVVILSPGESVSEYRERGYSVVQVVKIEGNCISMPCDRSLEG